VPWGRRGTAAGRLARASHTTRAVTAPPPPPPPSGPPFALTPPAASGAGATTAGGAGGVPTCHPPPAHPRQWGCGASSLATAPSGRQCCRVPHRVTTSAACCAAVARVGRHGNYQPHCRPRFVQQLRSGRGEETADAVAVALESEGSALAGSARPRPRLKSGKIVMRVVPDQQGHRTCEMQCHAVRSRDKIRGDLARLLQFPYLPPLTTWQRWSFRKRSYLR